MVARFRRQRIAWVRRTLGVFVLATLGMALQPCAMAMQPVPEGDCPHCPQAEQAVTPCDAQAQPDCMVENPVQGELRAAKLKAPDLHVDVLALAGSTDLFRPERSWCAAVHSAVDSPPHLDGPPLNVRFCVYLK